MISGSLIALRGEFMLATRAPRVLALILLPALGAALRIALGALGASTDAARDAISGGAFSEENAETTLATNAYGPFVDGLSAGFALAYLVVLGLAAYTLAADRENGVVRHLLVRRVSRGGLVVSKLLALLVFALVAVAGVVLASLAVAASLYEFGPIMEDGFELQPLADVHEELVLGLLYALIPLPATIALGVLVSTVARSASSAVALALGLGLAYDFFKELVGEASRFVWATYQPSLFDGSYLHEVVGPLAYGLADGFVEKEYLRLNWQTPIPACALFLALALVVAYRRRM